MGKCAGCEARKRKLKAAARKVKSKVKRRKR